ncbi:MAG: hypothetical protein ACI85I_000690 [Arenicella sp.]|jgi:hypothetical protein
MEVQFSNELGRQLFGGIEKGGIRAIMNHFLQAKILFRN